MPPHMSLAAIAAFSYAIAASAFLLLSLFLLATWRRRSHAAVQSAACLLTALWAAAMALLSMGYSQLALYGEALEIARTGSLLCLLLVLLGPPRTRLYAYLGGIAALCGLQLLAPDLIEWLAPSSGKLGRLATIVTRLAFALLGMLLVEQLYRNTEAKQRWGIKFACLGIGGLFAYDFYLYSDALLFRGINGEIWAARGIVNALTVPLLAASAARNPRWTAGLSVSRHILYHSAALIGSAIYLLAMASSAYYLSFVGGAWGRIMQVGFLFGAVILLVGVLFSGAVRARLKVLINKHFYREGFDYRLEWLRFTRALSEDGPGLGERTIQAVGGLVESPAGALWIRRDEGVFEAAAHWNVTPGRADETASGPFCQFLELRQWVVDVDECAANPQRYAELAVPAWLRCVPQLWLVVPLILHGRLFGFVGLARPRTPIGLNWEVTDLLKIAGSQAASYLAHRESANSLMVARQFESFNRMSTFIVHDLKNLVFQLSLLVSNAEKHKANPDFQADMIDTLDHSVQKMKLLLQKLSRGEAQDPASPLQLDRLLRQAIAAKSGAEPRPVLEIGQTGLAVLANWGRLERVLGHLIQNAIEASARDGRVTVRLRRQESTAVVELHDNGQGMSQEFIRERLFKPFETTKAAGMGIGVFESREYINEIGGQLDVVSEQDAGTTFRVSLPLYLEEGAHG